MKKNFLLIGLVWLVASFSYAIVPTQVAWDVVNFPFYPPQTGGTVSGRMIWGDFNNDGYLDVFFIIGRNSNNNPYQDGHAFLWKNNGDGTFTRVDAGAITPLTQSSAEFIDYDNDGNLDLVVMGKMYSPDDQKRVVRVYKNSGPPCYEFIEDKERSAELIDVATDSNDAMGRTIQAVDFDHDGWTDLIITGFRQTPFPSGNSRLTRIFKNVDGKFQMQEGNVSLGGTNKNFYELSRGSVHTGDINRDGYADIIVVGRRNQPSGGDWAYLYINNRNGTFRQSMDLAFDSSIQRDVDGEIVFADINGDGYDDIVEVINYGGQQRANIYINNGNETFTKFEKNVTGLIGASNQVCITAGDINNDGLLDLYITGAGDLSADGSGRIFYNNGDNKFTPVMLPEAVRAAQGSIGLVDIDRDSNLDYACFGFDNGGPSTGRKRGFGINKLGGEIPVNTPPVAPENFEVTFNGNKYLLTWDMASDNETPQNALRYNVFAENSENGMVYVYAPVDILTGKLKIGGTIVPLIKPNSFEWFLPEGNYTFGVQTVDQADLASKFTTTSNVIQGINLTHKNAVRVFTDNNKTIVIENTLPTDVPYTVLNVSGQIIVKDVCPAGMQQTVQGLTQGVYIVKTTERAVKALIF